MIYARMWIAGVGIALGLGLSGCAGVTQADRDLAREILAQSGSNCIHIQGSGGVGVGTPGVPLAGGYGQGSLSAAHSEGGKNLECGSTGAKVSE